MQASSNLRAEGWLKCRFDAKDRIVYTDATFTVRSFGGEFEGFRLRLPPEAQLSKDDPRFRDLEPAAAGGGLGDVLHVRHDRTAEPVVAADRATRAACTDDPWKSRASKCWGGAAVRLYRSRSRRVAVSME